MKQIFLLCVLLLSYQAFADTTFVSAGVISGTWTKAKSPYVVSGNVKIADNTSLIIEPGVKVLLKGSNQFKVQGKLIAIGTKADSIYFKPYSKDSSWYGIRFDTIKTTNDTSKFTYCRIEGGWAKGGAKGLVDWIGFGGAVYIYNFSKVVMENCLITNNIAKYRGAGVMLWTANIIIRNNTFSNNTVIGTKNGIGAGVTAYSSSPIFVGNKLINNYSDSLAGGFYGYKCKSVIENNEFIDNYAKYYGGGVFISGTGYSVLRNNKFIRNLAAFYGGASVTATTVDYQNNIFINNASNLGGAVFHQSALSKMSNNLFANNTAITNGGAIYFSGSNSSVSNNTFANNEAKKYGGAFANYKSSPVVTNSIFWGNKAVLKGNQLFALDSTSRAIISYCDFQGGQSGIDIDTTFTVYKGILQNSYNLLPKFSAPTSDVGYLVDATKSDWTLKSGSPCINTGRADTSGLYIYKYDLAGNPRVYQDVIDMGAYEYQYLNTPVELTTFTAQVNGHAVDLLWKTATESNNMGFEIERAVAGNKNTNWEKISFVKGAGNSTSVKEYKYSEVLNKSGKYQYRIKQIDYDGNFSYSNVLVAQVGQVLTFGMNQNYPNPFNPTTKISYSLPEQSYVQLKIFNILGKEIAVLVNGQQVAGNYSVDFNASGFSTGVYFAKITAGNYVKTIKMSLVK